MHQVCIENHLAANYPYIRAENSSTDCTSIVHHGFCKMLWYCSILFILNQSGQLWIKEKNNNSFTGLNKFFKTFIFRFWSLRALILYKLPTVYIRGNVAWLIVFKTSNICTCIPVLNTSDTCLPVFKTRLLYVYQYSMRLKHVYQNAIYLMYVYQYLFNASNAI